MLSFGAKKRNQTFFFQKNIFFNQIFNEFILRMWTAWSNKLEKTQNAKLFEETEFVRFS